MTVDGSRLVVALYDMSEQQADALGDAFVGAARENAPYDTGALVDSITYTPPERAGNGWRVVVNVGEEYGRYQEEGTGEFGPLGTPIVPVNGRVLAWESGGFTVFATSVRGSPPTRWWSRTIAEWPSIVRSL